MTTATAVRDVISGPPIVLDGDDIDTDRIIPARFLKSLTFDALGKHVFEGERANARAAGQIHPFDDPRHEGAKVLLVGENFGCGSSREHAAQAINRWGVDAVAGVSFGEIFRGNCATIGLPCVTLSRQDSAAARAAALAEPTATTTVDLAARELRVGAQSWPIDLNESLRQRFLTGTWDTLTTLLAGAEDVRRTMDRLPYLNGWRTAAAATG
ncbi:3-isopropylmalate dehydratase small subunit [Streptomyces sp. UMAF16]|nr:3-isopropylmalate dehydratase small subunit [Streptomyces sp. UMAF16]